MIIRIARCWSPAALLAVAVLSPACAHAPAASQGHDAMFPAASQGHDAMFPSKLDYLVLASLADSPNLLALSAYSAAAPHASPQ